MNALIVGGGIAGLSLGLCLQRLGIDVQVLEQSGTIAEVGAGLQISPNGFRVLHALGLADAVETASFAPTALEMRDGRTGRTVFHVPLGNTARRRWGGDYRQIHRAALVGILEQALEARQPGALVLAKRIADISQNADGVAAITDDGQSYQADILIGADGIHSTVRHALMGDAPARFTGYLAWRTVVPTERLGALAPPPTACVWTGAGRHAVTYRLGDGSLSNLVGVVERLDWRAESWTHQGTNIDMLADFDGFHPVVTNMIASSDPPFCWALHDRAPLPFWSQGRITLMGDACHPTLPFMAQGAVMALEDAWILSACLAAPGSSINAALKTYQDLRLDRTRALQARARRNGAVFHLRNPLVRGMVHGVARLAGAVWPGLILAPFDPVYRYDPIMAGDQIGQVTGI